MVSSSRGPFQASSRLWARADITSPSRIGRPASKSVPGRGSLGSTGSGALILLCQESPLLIPVLFCQEKTCEPQVVLFWRFSNLLSRSRRLRRSQRKYPFFYEK